MQSFIPIFLTIIPDWQWIYHLFSLSTCRDTVSSSSCQTSIRGPIVIVCFAHVISMPWCKYLFVFSYQNSPATWKKCCCSSIQTYEKTQTTLFKTFCWMKGVGNKALWKRTLCDVTEKRHRKHKKLFHANMSVQSDLYQKDQIQWLVFTIQPDSVKTILVALERPTLYLKIQGLHVSVQLYF